MPDELWSVTRGWTVPSISRTYERNSKGQARLDRELRDLTSAGYSLAGQSETGGHVHVGRLLLSGGLSVLAGKDGIRSDGNLTLTFVRSVRGRSFVLSSEVRAMISAIERQIREETTKIGPAGSPSARLAGLRSVLEALQAGDKARALVTMEELNTRAEFQAPYSSTAVAETTTSKHDTERQSPRQPTLAGRLAQLRDAHAKGFLTDAEYESKRRGLISDF
jgi:hypothetical protein